jgi:TolA-binding protein
LTTKTLTDEQRQALLLFLLDIHRARRDKPAEERVAEQVDELLAKDPNNPAAGQAIARRKLQSASRAIESRNYRTAVEEINAARSRFVEPDQQAEALFILAEAAYGQADPNSANALKDAALAYMRVVAHFRSEPGRPFVAQSLLRTAEIHERLHEPQTASAIYDQIIQQFKDDPAAQVAGQNLQRLSGQSNAK